MSQAFDSKGSPLGKRAYGASLLEAFNKANEEHPDAHVIVTSKPNLKVRSAVRIALRLRS